MEMKATHSLHSKLDGHVVFLLHDNGAGQVHYKSPANLAWLLMSERLTNSKGINEEGGCL